MPVNRLLVLLLGIVATGCAVVATDPLEDRFGPAAPAARVVSSRAPGVVGYWDEVRPVLDRRCVVCHGCYDAPCQLKLSSIEGIERGASPAKVYDARRLLEAPLTRLHEDADGPAEWRTLGFHPVLNERSKTVTANREASLIFEMLRLKRENPQPEAPLLPASFDLTFDRKQSCPTAEGFARFGQEHPLWGMPYALPGILASESASLSRWVEQGAHYLPRPALAPEILREVERWEAFFNGDSLEEQLTSRYIFEHLFLANLYFDGVEPAEPRAHFRLVRSKTPPGEEIRPIPTRRPFDDPGEVRFYYRLRPEVDTILVKTHMPYALDDARMARWRALFLEPEYEVTKLPGYAPEVASNPFLTFHELPLDARYRFLLDEARNSIMSFIKGPVCRGQVALNVINDHFWIFFVDPGSKIDDGYEKFLEAQAARLDLPAAKGEIFNLIEAWMKYSKHQRAYLEARAQRIHEDFQGSRQASIDNFWDGDGGNENAALTVFRHFDSATVERGLLGGMPKTAWLMDYSLLERIHYLLVAGFDVFGNVGHQLVTRVYMDFLRMEGEMNFLYFLPEPARTRERELWYRGADEEAVAYLEIPRKTYEVEPTIAYSSDDPKRELFEMLAERLAPVLPEEHTLASARSEGARQVAEQLQGLPAPAASLLPEVTYVELRLASGSEHMTLVRNSAHSNITALFDEDATRLPEEDYVSALPGFVGAYPNVFLAVPGEDAQDFVDELSGIANESDYGALLDRYGVRRTNPGFWAHSDGVHRALRALDPVDAGLLDFNRLENR